MSLVKNALASIIQWVLIITFAALTLDVLWGVFSRYVLGDQSPWTTGLGRVLLIWISMLGAALAYGEGAHLGVDYFVLKMHPAARKVAAFFINLLVLMFAAVVMVYGGCYMVHQTFSLGEVISSPQLNKGYVYVATPLSGVLIAIYALDNLIRPFIGGGTDTPVKLSSEENYAE